MLSNKKIGFIGCGNMAKSIIGGLIASGKVEAGNIYASDTNYDKSVEDAKSYGYTVLNNNESVVKSSDVIVLAVKPYGIADVLNEVKCVIDNDKIIVSIAAGVTISAMESIIGCNSRIVRVMPNTPALVGEGMSSITGGCGVQEGDVELVQSLFDCVGKTVVVKEDYIHAIVGVAGSSPAFIFQIIEAMSDAGVKAGLTRDDAIKISAQAVLGSAKMVLESGKHPAQLKDMVTSPAGTTIEGVIAMDNAGVRAGIISAVTASVEKSIKMSK